MGFLTKASRFLIRQLDVALLVVLLLVKVYIFSEESGTLFITLEPLEYIKEFFAWLTGKETELNIFEGVAMISLGTILLATFWIVFLRGRKRLVAIFIMNLLLSFVILADVIYFRYFGDIISITVLMQMGQMGDVGDSVFALFSWRDLIFLADVLLMIPLLIFYFRKTKGITPPKHSFVPRLVTGLLVLFVGYQLTFVPFNKSMENGGEWQFNKLISNMRVYNFTGLLGFHVANIDRYINDNYINKKVYSDEEVDAVEKWLGERTPAASSYSGMAEGKNVIVLQVEALQNFVIDRKINGDVITPNLNRLIKEEALYFPNFYEQTGLGRTSDAEFLLNTSLYPTAKGSAYMLYPKNTFDSLPKALEEKGYNTNVFHAYEPSFWNRYIMYNNFGIDTFFSQKDFGKDEKIGMAINDNDMLKQSLAKMEKLEKPFYSHIISLTSHHPFEMPDQYNVLNMEGYGHYDKRHFRNYLQSIHFVDQAIGNFVQDLKDKGMWDDTMLVIFGDHSTGLTKDDPAFGEFADAKEALSYFEADKNVPLIMHVPGVEKPERFDQIGSQVDMAPTILDIIGGPVEDQHWLGRNLWDMDNRQATFRDGSFVTEDLTFIASSDGAFSKGACYDRAAGKTVDVEACKPIHANGVEELRMSDDVLDGDMIERFKK
ncbi:LTA synthase family protein [Planococcus sp. YIM B11945]|uniref:LTA synthase family protein n=1 Tax=Planococcus sp. YIM B11945 TaxID=3435410 RepID=UPI003D7CAEF6